MQAEKFNCEANDGISSFFIKEKFLKRNTFHCKVPDCFLIQKSTVKDKTWVYTKCVRVDGSKLYLTFINNTSN